MGLSLFSALLDSQCPAHHSLSWYLGIDRVAARQRQKSTGHEKEGNEMREREGQKAPLKLSLTVLKGGIRSSMLAVSLHSSVCMPTTTLSLLQLYCPFLTLEHAYILVLSAP